MHSVAWTWIWLLAAFLALDSALLVSADVFFLKPEDGSTCTAGVPCTIEWIDDGNTPQLSAVGVVTAALYTGEQQVVQRITPLDVSTIHSIEFTPNAQAGPDSDTYYVAFTSITSKVNGTASISFSPFFRLEGMSGSFDSPLPAATSTIPIPGSLTRSSTNKVGTTITVGTINTSRSFPPVSFSTSKLATTSSTSTTFSSQFSQATISTSAKGSLSSPSSPSSAIPRLRIHSLPLLAVLSLCAIMFS
ncbi:hypothetical protein C8J57DRAFT_1271225 [Mycena rebaudengoi]|nr:hypothetical protein C8J57DRAFT_1271225 [Mycena rebaudengoi]